MARTCPFVCSGARLLWVAGKYTTDILSALRPADEDHTTDPTILPALRNLRVQNPILVDGQFCDAAVIRQLTGALWPSLRATIYMQEYKRHLVDVHVYRTVCSYFDDFECTPGHDDDLFRHLANELPDADPLNSNPDLQSPYSGSHST